MTDLLLHFFDQRPLLGVLLMLMGLDIITGLLAAVATKTVSSTVSAAGIAKKALTLCLIATLSVLEPYVSDMPISRLASFGFTITEVLSIIENCGRAGIVLPIAITKTLEKLKDKEDV